MSTSGPPAKPPGPDKPGAPRRLLEGADLPVPADVLDGVGEGVWIDVIRKMDEVYNDLLQYEVALEQKNAEISAHEAALQNANELLSAKADELYQAAITDPLTGAYNRGYLLRELDERLRRCAAERRPLALLLIDFDHFKQINDQHGHLFGDRVLASGVQVMRQWLEPRDLLGRYGGEEFVVILDGVDLDRAAAHGERLRERMAQALADAIGAKRPLTVSIGVASTEQLDDTSLEALLNAADLALYRAKAEGRNRVVRFAA